MYDFIPEFFLTKPRRIVSLARVGFSLAGFLIICGLIARVALVGVPAIRAMGSASAEPVTLELLYPTLPTWWIPESALGYALAGGLAVAFIALAVVGRQLERFLDN